jgi:hypothetical protein
VEGRAVEAEMLHSMISHPGEFVFYDWGVIADINAF